MGSQVARLLRTRAEAAPDRTSLRLASEGLRRVSFAELDARAGAIAWELGARGLRPGDRVALCGDNDLDFVACVFGAFAAGLVVVPIPSASTAADVRFRLEHADVALTVVDEARRALVHEAGPRPSVLARELGRGPRRSEPLALPSGAIALLLFTSGTTASAKAACIGHASLVAHTTAIAQQVLRLDADDVVLGTLPLTHSYGLRMALLAPLIASASTVLLPRFSTASVVDALRDAGVTWFPGVPTMFSALARVDARADASRLRWCLSAGAPLPPAVRERAERALGAPIREGFGLTEATFTTIDTPRDPEGAGTVGRAVPGVEVRVVDEADLDRALGEPGEVLVRGPNVMLRYLDDEAATAEAMRGGWLHTGDLGTLDAEGRLRIVDRKKDLILRGGFNVVPSEVEAALVAHPDVAEALVVGVPDEHQGEEIAAILVLRRPPALDLPSLRAHLEAHLAAPRRPRRFAVVPALPIGASGKALRRVVRDRITAGALRLAPIDGIT